MSIFNGNSRLEQATQYALDWGLFLRHDLESPVIPFVYLFNGNEIETRVLMVEGDPVPYAAQILAKEETPFQQYVIGFEGYMRNDKNERVDAIIVQGFDKTQEKGVSLGQMFAPKEALGTFKKIDKPTFLGHPASPLEVIKTDSPNYTAEKLALHTVTRELEGLIQPMAFFSHHNPSVIANAIKRFLRTALSDNNGGSLSGRFELKITPGLIGSDDFLKYLVLQAIEEERTSQQSMQWQKTTGRKLLFTVHHGDTAFLVEFDAKTEPGSGGQPEETPDLEDRANKLIDKYAEYASWSVEALDKEFTRIISTADFSALISLTALREEYRRRGIATPNERPKTVDRKPWWKFW